MSVLDEEGQALEYDAKREQIRISNEKLAWYLWDTGTGKILRSLQGKSIY